MSHSILIREGQQVRHFTEAKEVDALIEKIKAQIGDADKYVGTWVNIEGQELQLLENNLKTRIFKWVNENKSHLLIGGLTLTNFYLLYLNHTLKQKQCPPPPPDSTCNPYLAILFLPYKI